MKKTFLLIGLLVLTAFLVSACSSKESTSNNVNELSNTNSNDEDIPENNDLEASEDTSLGSEGKNPEFTCADLLTEADFQKIMKNNNPVTMKEFSETASFNFRCQYSAINDDPQRSNVEKDIINIDVNTLALNADEALQMFNDDKEFYTSLSKEITEMPNIGLQAYESYRGDNLPRGIFVLSSNQKYTYGVYVPGISESLGQVPRAAIDRQILIETAQITDNNLDKY